MLCVCDPNPSTLEEGAGGPENKTSMWCVVKICVRAGKVRVRDAVWAPAGVVVHLHSDIHASKTIHVYKIKINYLKNLKRTF